MKLLLDENLSRRLVAALQDLYPGTTHVEYVGLDGAADLAICDYAGEHGFVMVTKDVDYDLIIALRNFNPKLIRLTLGNTSNAATLHGLRSRSSQHSTIRIAAWLSWGDGVAVCVDRTPERVPTRNFALFIPHPAHGTITYGNRTRHPQNHAARGERRRS